MLLEPGGYIQWVEHDKTAIVPVAVSPAQPTTAAQAFIDLQQSPFPNYNARQVSSIDLCDTILTSIVAGFSILPQEWSQLDWKL